MEPDESETAQLLLPLSPPLSLQTFPSPQLWRRILCVYLPTWPTDRVRRRQRDGARAAEPSGPLVSIQTTGNGQRTLVSACALAQARGLTPGMTLAQANVICAGLSHVPSEPARDAVALAALGRWMARRFTPIVAVEGIDALLLEIGGSERLFGGIEAIVAGIGRSLRAMGVRAALAVAPTPGAAWALAFTSRAGRRQARFVMDPRKLSAALAPLPPIALRIEPAVAASLRHMGVETIAQLRGLTRDALPARFGKTLLRRLDQATGALPEPLVPLTWQAPVVASREWEGPVEALDALASVLESLLDDVLIDLARRGHGARKLELTFRCAYAPAIVQSIALSRPTRERRNLMGLLRCALETVESTEGFTAILLRVPLAEPLAASQASLIDQPTEQTGDAINGLVERLRIRLGEDALQRAEPVESHLPERAVRYANIDGGAYGVDSKAIEAKLPAAPRPTQLLPRPLEIGVTVSPSNDREGHPVSFTHEGRVHRLRIAIGPERIAGVWWTGHDRTRDYFDAIDEAGRRFWIFRVLETWRWYLHGWFG